MVLFNNQLPGSAFGERYIGVPHDNDILSGEILQAKTELKAEPVASSEIPNEKLPNLKSDNSKTSTPTIDLFFDKNQKLRRE